MLSMAALKQIIINTFEWVLSCFMYEVDCKFVSAMANYVIRRLFKDLKYLESVEK